MWLGLDDTAIIAARGNAIIEAILQWNIYYNIELGNITILSFIMISKCHDNQYRREIFNIVISGSTILS